jgi:hypothetical protein
MVEMVTQELVAMRRGVKMKTNFFKYAFEIITLMALVALMIPHENLAEQKKNVVMVENLPSIDADMSANMNWYLVSKGP